MRKIKTVVSIEIDGVIYFRMDSGVCYWTDSLKDAKMYSGKAKAKIAEVKNYILSGNDPNNFNPNNRPRMYLYTQGGFTGFQDKDAIFLKDEYVRTIKLHEVIFDIKPCKV